MFVVFLIARHTAPHDCTHTDTCHHVVQPKREIPNRHHLACAESKKDTCYSMPKCRVIHQTQWSSFHIPLISPSYLISTLPFLWHLYSPHTYTTASTFGLLASKKKPPQTQGPNQQGSKTPRIAVLYPSSLIGRAWRLAPEPNLLAVIQSKTGDQSFDTSPTNGRA